MTSLSHRRIADAVLGKTPPPKLPQGLSPSGLMRGVVQSIQAGPPPTLTLTLAGSTKNVSGIRFMADYLPTVGDTVVISMSGGDLFVWGALNSSGPASPWLYYATTTPNTSIAGGGSAHNYSVLTIHLPINTYVTIQQSVLWLYLTAGAENVATYITVDGATVGSPTAQAYQTITPGDPEYICGVSQFGEFFSAGTHTIGWYTTLGGGVAVTDYQNDFVVIVGQAGP